MNEILFSTPLLNFFDFIAAALFFLMTSYLGFHFILAKFYGVKRGAEIMILSLGYTLSALLILFKAYILNNNGHTIFDRPTPFILLFSFQMFMPSLIFIYQKISKNNIIKPSILVIVMLFIFNIFILKLLVNGTFTNQLSFKILIGTIVLIMLGSLVVIETLFLKKAKKIIVVNKVSDSDFRNNIFVFLISSLFLIFSIILFFARAPILFYYIEFYVFILISVIYVVSTIVSFQMIYPYLYATGTANENNLSEHYRSGYFDHSIHSGNFCIEQNKIEELRARLIKYFEEEKPYLRSNLTINEVSLNLYTNKTYLSRVINESMNKNFNQLLNNYRIDEAKRLFFQNQNISMEDLCVKSGFGSMASFTIAFRIYAGTSPSDWCKDQKVKIRNNEVALIH